MEKYPDRWQLYDNSTTPNHCHQLLKYFGSGDDMQVDCVIFNQFFGYSDATAAASGLRSKTDDSPDKVYTSGDVVKSVMPVMTSKEEPIDDTCFFHKASGMLITGHHYEFAYFPIGWTEPPEMADPSSAFMFKLLKKMMRKPGRYDTALEGMGRLRDPAAHSQQWQEVMKWDFKYACSHHDPVGICGPLDNDEIMNGEGGVKGHMKRMLEASGELNNTPIAGSWWPWVWPNLLHKVIAAEPGFVAKYGEPPVLRMGGPGYDENGLKK